MLDQRLPNGSAAPVATVTGSAPVHYQGNREQLATVYKRAYRIPAAVADELARVHIRHSTSAEIDASLSRALGVGR